MKRFAILCAALALAACSRPVDEPFDSNIRAACAKQFPHDAWRRWDCVDIGRRAHVIRQGDEAFRKAEWGN